MSDEQGEQPRQTAVFHMPKADVLATPSFDAADAAAIQALAAGIATPDQQRLGLNWIVNNAAATYDGSYRPDSLGGARATDFAEGRRFVGTAIILLTKIKTSKL